METPRPVLRGKYSIRNPAANFLFRCLDAVLSIFARSLPVTPPVNPHRILISDIAHLGDVIMATALLPVLKSVFPDCRIGFLVGSWAQPVLKNHPLVDDVYLLDHWMHNRAGISRWKKFARYLQSRRTALRQIKEAQYDVAFDFYWNFPNTLPLLRQAKIPMRVGYESGGFGPLATHCLEFGDKRLHAAQRFWDLVAALPQISRAAAGVKPVLIPSLPPLNASDPGVIAFEAELAKAGLQGKEYLVFHVGAADDFRDWPASNWRELAKMLTMQGHLLLFTGAGDKDEARIRQIQEGIDGCVNFCNKLEWSGYVAAIACTRLLICVDTVAGHIAAATGTPCLVITAGRWPYLWRPLGTEVRVLMHPVPCAPCHRNNGCAGMECIQNTSVSDVYQEAQNLLHESYPHSFPSLRGT